MTGARLLTRFNLLPFWRRRVHAWGSDIEAITFDRYLNLYLHRAGLRGREEKRFLEGVVRPGMHVIDVGANIGIYTLLLSRLVGESGRVTAIEPEPDLFEALKTNCRLNSAKNVRPYNVAAGATSKVGVLSRSFVHAGDNRMGLAAVSEIRKPVEVRVTTIDEIVGGEHVDFIKIDVQGWEGEVLKGMQQVLACNASLQICFEYWPYGLRAAGCDPLTLLREFGEHGFRLWQVSKLESGPITEFTKLLDLGGQGYTDLYAARGVSVRFV
jgi:FkbM family methyltransferase